MNSRKKFSLPIRYEIHKAIKVKTNHTKVFLFAKRILYPREQKGFSSRGE